MGSFTGIGKLPSELTEKTSLSETDIVITGSSAQRTTWKNVLEKISFSGLATTAKNIIGAINELNTKMIASKTTGYQTSDINDIKENCICTCTTSTPNIPVSEYGFLIHACTVGGYVQLFFALSSNTMYTRIYANNTWRSWSNR